MTRAERWCRRLIAVAAPLAPRDLREDWRREWLAEVDWAASTASRSGTRRVSWALVGRCTGAFAHASWLRWDRWRPSMIWYDTRIAARTLLRTPAFLTLAVLTLGVGIGANVAIFSAVRAVLLRPLPFPDSDRLVALYTSSPRMGASESSPPDFVDWWSAQRSLSAMAALTAETFAVAGDRPAEQVPGASVTGDFFAVLGVPAARGRTLTPADAVDGAAPAVVVSHRLWQRRFNGASDLVGMVVTVDGMPRTIVGVLAAGREYPLGSDLWVPMTFTPEELRTQRGAQYLDVVGRLAPDATETIARAEISIIAKRLAATYPATNEGRDVVVQPLRSAVVGDVRPALMLLLAAAGVVLVVVCVNVAGLALARGAARTRDLAIRQSLGAGRWRLARAALVESGLVGLAGGATGVGFGWMGTRVIASVDPDLATPLVATTSIDGPVLAVSLVVSVLSAVGFGLGPAWRQAGRADAAPEVRTSAPTMSRRRGRSALVVAQLSLATVLVVGALTLAANVARLVAVDIGFEASSRVQTFAVTLPDTAYATPAARRQFTDRLLARIRALPGVDVAGAVFGMPLTGFGYTISVYERDGVRVSDTPAEMILLGVRVVTPDYFEAMGMTRRSGRVFGLEDGPDGPATVVLNEAAAKILWPNADAVGHTVTMGTRLGQGGDRVGGAVVGVVADTLDQGPASRARPMIYAPYARFPMNFVAVAARMGAGGPTVSTLRDVVAETDPNVPVFRERTTRELASAALAQPRALTWLIGAFAAAALLVSALGLYGLLTHVVTMRLKEFGIRRAVGATSLTIVRLVSRHALGLVLGGALVGAAASLALSRVLSKVAAGADTVGPIVYVEAAMVFALVAAAAAWAPCRRALTADPVETLRTE